MPKTHRTISEIADEMEAHHEEYPEHGLNCICMDPLIREIKAQFSYTQVEYARLIGLRLARM